MKKNLTKLMLVALVAILPLSMFAQKKKNVPVEKYFYIQAEGGLSVNHGDLANYGGVAFYQDGNFVIDNYFLKNYDGKVGLGYQLGKVIGINAKYGTATLAGEKHGQQLVVIDPADPAMANKGFEDAMLDKTTFMEANLNLTFNLTNLFFGYNPRRVFNFIPHLGIGGIRYHAGAVTSTTGAAAPNLAAKTDAEMTYTVPVGAELNFNLARMLDFYIDYTFTWAGNDKLDQVAKLPDDIQVINDMYSSVNAGLRLKFNKKPCDIYGMAARANEIGMRTDPEQLEEKDGKVCFDVIFDIPAEYFEKEAVMNITPTFTYNGGQLELDPVTFVGEKAQGGDFTVNYKNGGQFTKNYCVDYIPELESAKLMGNPMFYVYNGTIYPTQDEIAKNTEFAQGGDRLINQGVLVPVVKCEVSNIRTNATENSITVSWNGNAESYDIFCGEGTPGEPTVKGVKATTYTFNDVVPGDYSIYVKANCGDGNMGEWQPAPVVKVLALREPIAIFYFDYESATLKSNTKMNKTALKAIAEKLAAGEAITGFEIEGWASPENGDGNNSKLSADRADAVVSAIKAQLKKVKLNEKDFTFDATGFGSDWALFEELVQNSNIKDKDQILRVINNAGSDSKKEQEIQNMKKVYPELEKDILPLIRRAEVYLK